MYPTIFHIQFYDELTFTLGELNLFKYFFKSLKYLAVICLANGIVLHFDE